MLVEDMATLLRLYTDEPDQSVQSDARAALWLEQAYNDFRSIVCELDPTIYSVSYDATPAGASVLDLAGTLLGPTTTQPKLDTLLDITVIQGARETLRWKAGTNIDDVIHGNADYALIGTELRLPSASSESIRIRYMPVQNVTWAAGIVPLSNVSVDDLDRFHDVIPLLAYLQYAIVDAADHPQLFALLQRRLGQLKSYLQQRGGPGADEVVDSRWMES